MMSVIGKIVNGEYVSLRESTPAEKQRLKEMLAERKAPTSVTDREFFAGRWDQVHNGKIYHPGLAEFPNDPRAWVDSKDDIKRICEEKGWGCKGMVNVEPQQPHEEPKDIPVDPQLIDDEVDAIIDFHEDPQSIDREELWHETYEQRKPHWAE